MVSGASVCPMKMLAATFNDSAPLAPMMRVITHAAPRISTCITPMWYSSAKNAAIKIMVGST